MDILKIKLSGLKNETHVEFHQNVKKTIEAVGARDLEIDSLFPLYVSALDNELESLNFIRKSQLTEQIIEQDRVRDSVFRGFSDSIKSFRNHFDADYRVAANVLWAVMLHYGNIARKTLDDQATAIEDLMSKLQHQECDEALSFLRLHEWKNKLEEENEKFRNLMTDRYNEKGKKTSLRMLETRAATDKYYNGMLMILNAKILADYSSPQFDQFVKDLNAVIKRYKDILAQDFGRKNAASKLNNPKEKIIEVEKLDDGKFKVTKT